MEGRGAVRGEAGAGFLPYVQTAALTTRQREAQCGASYGTR